jgi:hypothetical protein
MLQHKGGQHEGALDGNFGLTATQLAHGFGDNAGTIAVGTSPTRLASVTVTPTVTGKFRVTGTVVAQGVSFGAKDKITAPPTITLSIGDGNTGIPDYSATDGPSVPVGSNVTAAITAEYPNPFPLGIPVELDLYGTASALNSITVPNAHDAQYTVEELPN